MKTKNLLYLIIVFLLFSSADCGKKEKPIFYMPQEFKDYVMFPVGSYWVYEDSITGEIDSLNLISQTTELLDPNNYDCIYEKVHQYLFQLIYNDTIYRSGGINHNNYSSYIYYESGYEIFFSNVYVGSESDNLVYELYYDSLKINDIWYKNVKLFSNINQLNNLQPKKIYFAINIGIIKRKMFDGRVWELKNNNIN